MPRNEQRVSAFPVHHASAHILARHKGFVLFAACRGYVVDLVIYVRRVRSAVYHVLQSVRAKYNLVEVGEVEWVLVFLSGLFGDNAGGINASRDVHNELGSGGRCKAECGLRVVAPYPVRRQKRVIPFIAGKRLGRQRRRLYAYRSVVSGDLSRPQNALVAFVRDNAGGFAVASARISESLGIARHIALGNSPHKRICVIRSVGNANILHDVGIPAKKRNQKRPLFGCEL